MSGIIHKIEETLHIGGHKPEDKHKEGEHHDDKHDYGHDKHDYGHDKHDHKDAEHYKPAHHGEEHKEGLVDKIKDKIHGEGGHEGEDKKKKKKKEKKKHEHGHGHDSSSSDSD